MRAFPGVGDRQIQGDSLMDRNRTSGAFEKVIELYNVFLSM